MAEVVVVAAVVVAAAGTDYSASAVLVGEEATTFLLVGPRNRLVIPWNYHRRLKSHWQCLGATGAWAQMGPVRHTDRPRTRVQLPGAQSWSEPVAATGIEPARERTAAAAAEPAADFRTRWTEEAPAVAVLEGGHRIAAAAVEGHRIAAAAVGETRTAADDAAVGANRIAVAVGARIHSKEAWALQRALPSQTQRDPDRSTSFAEQC